MQEATAHIDEIGSVQAKDNSTENCRNGDAREQACDVLLRAVRIEWLSSLIAALA